MAKPEHVGQLLKGFARWNEWRLTRPEDLRPDFSNHDFEGGAFLSGAHLDAATFRGAHLDGTNFIAAHLANADFDGAQVRHGCFERALLTEASFYRANLDRASFRAAQLLDARFSDAKLDGTDFRDSELNGAVFSGAHLDGADFREATGLVLNGCRTKGVQFTAIGDWIHLAAYWSTRWIDFQKHTRHRGPIDPWSRLRTAYSGPKFFYHLLFLVAFALPLVLNAVTWKAANRGQQTLAHMQQTVALELADVDVVGATARRDLHDAVATKWEARNLPSDGLAEAQALAVQAFDAAGVSSHAELLARINARLGVLKPCLQANCGPARPMWYVMLGFDRGWRTAAIAALLILYNISRFIITRAVGDMRDNEERTGWCPALKDYGPYYVAHKFMTGLFIVAVLGGAMEIGLFLFTDFVYLPA